MELYIENRTQAECLLPVPTQAKQVGQTQFILTLGKHTMVTENELALAKSLGMRTLTHLNNKQILLGGGR